MTMRQSLSEQDYDQIAKFLATPAYERRPELLIPEEVATDEPTETEQPSELPHPARPGGLAEGGASCFYDALF